MEILIAGAGQMGSGIAQVAALHGHTVLLNDRDNALIERGIASIRKNLDRLVEKARITEAQRDEALNSIRGTPALKSLQIEMAIEAATEDFETKLALFALLDAQTPKRAILASNTSSISITALGRVRRSVRIASSGCTS